MLINAGADLHIKNSKALTAVGCAANNGQPEVVLKLVSNGAAWRNLPDINVVKTICRKTNYKSVICSHVNCATLLCSPLPILLCTRQDIIAVALKHEHGQASMNTRTSGQDILRKLYGAQFC